MNTQGKPSGDDPEYGRAQLDQLLMWMLERVQQARRELTESTDGDLLVLAAAVFSRRWEAYEEEDEYLEPLLRTLFGRVHHANTEEALRRYLQARLDAEIDDETTGL